ncbi:endonuclease domain-containing 1 protein-like [Hyla sarda]|uniref:endonuclease domain-containing 1 protein-like n=1 Tax=Hyla sarda TaxID=327740 RepID=UPI0024C37822|nr:endonuclease domain-containing 1 protein-like [Hyla sarda]
MDSLGRVLVLLVLCSGGFCEVLQSFSDVPNCQNFFYRGQEPLGLASNTTASICQCLQGGYHYATLYHRLARVPIYSAYILEVSTTPRPDLSSSNWYLEPMLGGVFQKEMLQPSSSTMQQNLPDVEDSQAVNDDYRNSGYSRGHVNPSGHHSRVSQLSTFTFTNMAPQDSTFNSGTWNQYETFLRDKILTSCQQTYVLSGVIISGSHPGEGKWLRNRVNVPTFFWSAFCCVRSDGTRRVEGRLGRNTSPYDVVTKTIPELEAILGGVYGGRVALFSGGCQ